LNQDYTEEDEKDEFKVFFFHLFHLFQCNHGSKNRMNNFVRIYLMIYQGFSNEELIFREFHRNIDEWLQMLS